MNALDMKLVHSRFQPASLADKLRRARSALFEMCETLAEDQWLGPRLGTVNRPVWELENIA